MISGLIFDILNNKLLILFLSEFAFADNRVKHFDCDSVVGCINNLESLDGLLELTDTEVLESGNIDCCLSDLDGTGIGELVVVAAGNFAVVVSVAVVPLIVVVVAAEIVAVVAVEVVAVVVAVVDTAEVGGIDTNLPNSVSDLDFPELGIVLHFW